MEPYLGVVRPVENIFLLPTDLFLRRAFIRVGHAGDREERVAQML